MGKKKLRQHDKSNFLDLETGPLATTFPYLQLNQIKIFHSLILIKGITKKITIYFYCLSRAVCHGQWTSI